MATPYTTSETGAFQRQTSSFRNKIEVGGQYPPEGGGRYHLYVSYACPWASRCLAILVLKQIKDSVIPVHTVAPVWSNVAPEGEEAKRSWVFSEETIGGLKCNDPLNNFKSVRELYLSVEPNYNGRFTVPILWCSKTKTIVNNESAEIAVMLNDLFNDFAGNPSYNLVPKEHEQEINRLNDWMYETINNGVYKCGFATKQQAYNEAFQKLFNTLDEAEALLGQSRFLVKGTTQPTFSDIRLFVTIIRFDSVYYVHFKTNKKLIEQYENLRNWVRDVYQWPGVKETVNFTHIKNHYYASHDFINPHGIVPLGPEVDYNTPHNRNKLN